MGSTEKKGRSRGGVRALMAGVVLVASMVLGMVGVASASAPVSLGGRSPSAVVHVTQAARAPALSHVQYSSSKVNGLRFHTQSAYRGYVRGQLYRGDRVQVVGWSGHWMHVKLTKRSRGGLRAGSIGWVWKSYLYGPQCRSYGSWPCTAWR